MPAKKTVAAKSVEKVEQVKSVPAPSPAPEVVPEKPVDEKTVTEETTTPEVVGDKFAQVLDTLQSLVNDAKELISVVKTLQKEHVKLQKQVSKKTKRAPAADGAAKRNPSGFAKPTKLSDELCDFLGVSHGSSMARTIVTKHINDYIKKQNLQDAADKRHILPDDRLKGILSLKEGDRLTYFNLQTYIKQHFKKD